MHMSTRIFFVATGFPNAGGLRSSRRMVDVERTACNEARQVAVLVNAIPYSCCPPSSDSQISETAHVSEP